MAVFGQSCCILAKVVVCRSIVVVYSSTIGYTSGKEGCIRAKIVEIGAKWLNSEKMWLYYGQSGSFPEKLAVFGQQWLYSGKSGCIRTKVDCIQVDEVVIRKKMVVFGQSSCIRAKLFDSDKVVVFGQKLLYSGQGACILAKYDCIRANWLYSVKSGFIRAKWLYSGKGGCIRAKRLYSGKKLLFSCKVVEFGIIVDFFWT